MNSWRRFSMIQLEKNSQGISNGRSKCSKSTKLKWIGKKFPRTVTLYGHQPCWISSESALTGRYFPIPGVKPTSRKKPRNSSRYWSVLSGNSDLNLNYQMIDRFIDLWDWSELIDRWREEELYTLDFMERYADKIPSSKLQDSRLWTALVEKRAKDLKLEVIA